MIYIKKGSLTTCFYGFYVFQKLHILNKHKTDLNYVSKASKYWKTRPSFLLLLNMPFGQCETIDANESFQPLLLLVLPSSPWDRISCQKEAQVLLLKGNKALYDDLLWTLKEDQY